MHRLRSEKEGDRGENRNDPTVSNSTFQIIPALWMTNDAENVHHEAQKLKWISDK